MKKSITSLVVGLLLTLVGWAICEHVVGVNEWTGTIFICLPLVVVVINLGNILAKICEMFGKKVFA